MRATAFVASLVLATAALPCAPQDGMAFNLGGSLESRPFAAWAGDAGWTGSWSYGSATGLDLELSARGPSGPVRASAGASLEVSALTGAAAGAAWGAALLAGSASDTFYAPLPDLASPAPEALAAFRLRSAWAKLDWGWASLTAGRQVLSWGQGQRWSPIDLFTRYETSGISTAKKGSDALRLRLPFGDTGMADLAAAPTASPSGGAYAFRVSGLAFPGFDLGGLAAFAGEGATTSLTGSLGPSFMAGADFKFDLGAAFHGEALWLQPADGGAGLLRASFGADWSTGDLVMAAEYYFNGGVDASADPYAAGAHNFYASLTWKATDFLGLQGSLTWDLGDARGSALLLASLDAAQGATLAAYLRGSRTASTSQPWVADGGLDLRISF
jgi:hypothetical protein